MERQLATLRRSVRRGRFCEASLTVGRGTSMTEERDFLDAIADAPDDDDLRLIYTDWLDERDDPRGEFIRVQIELARWPEDAPERAGLAAREHELRTKYLPSWLGPLWGLEG